MSSTNFSRRSSLTKIGLALGATALGQILPEGILRLPRKRALWLPEAYANSELLGPSLPVVTAVQTVNQLRFLIVSELYANKGIVNAAENDRFVFEVRANFFNAQTGGFISATGPQEFGVQPGTDAELRKGSTVKVVPLTLTIPAGVSGAVESILNAGIAVTYQAIVSLVLVDGAGGRHSLDSMTTTGRIMPAPPGPTIMPTSGIFGTLFTITDPQGRMVNADRIIFTPPFQDPRDGTQADSPTFSADGKTATGLVPFTVATDYFVTVHEGDPTLNVPLFEGLTFRVTA
jgi:hypothetical protein